MGTLLVQTPSGSHFHRLSERAVVLGRSREADIQVAARGVSRRHCSVQLAGLQHVIEDLDSKNGLYVNDERVRRCVLRNNDCIILGEARLYYYTASASDAPPAKTSNEPPAAAPAERGSSPSAEGPLRWVESPSEVLRGRADDSDEHVLRPTPEPIPGKEGGLRKLERQIEALKERRRLLDIRCLALERMAFAGSSSQLFERAGEVLVEEFGAVTIAVFRDHGPQAEPALVYLRLGGRLTALPGKAPGETTVTWNRTSINAVRQAMKPMAFRLSAERAGPAGTAAARGDVSSYILAPLMSGGRWYGVLQMECRGENDSAEESRLAACGEVAAAISLGLANLADSEEDGAVDETQGLQARRGWPSAGELSTVLYWRIGLAEDGWPQDSLGERLMETEYFLSETARMIQGMGGICEGPAGAGVIFRFEAPNPEGSVAMAADAAVQALIHMTSRRRAGHGRLACGAIVGFGPLAHRSAASRRRAGQEAIPSLLGTPLDEVVSLSPYLRDGDLLATPLAASHLQKRASSAGQWVDWSAPTMDDMTTLFSGWVRLRWRPAAGDSPAGR